MQAAKAMVTPLGSLQAMLHAHIRRVDEERPAWRLHASSVTKEDGFCPRYPVLAKLHDDKPPATQNVTTSMAVTWEWGRLVERRVIDWFGEIGVAHGDWLCEHSGCRFTHEWRTRPKRCVKCGGTIFRYVEPRATSTVSGISSGLDMLTRMPGRPHLVFTEIKSIDAEKFKQLLGPLAEHRLRTTLSLRNIAESSDPRMKQVDDQVAYTLYVSKGGFGVKTAIEGGFSPFKEYQIHRNDNAVEPYVQAARQAHLALQGLGPMPERVCKSYMDKMAQRCPRMAECFKADA